MLKRFQDHLRSKQQPRESTTGPEPIVLRCSDAESANVLKSLLAVANSYWRLRQLYKREASSISEEFTRRSNRHLDAIEAALKEVEIEVQDHSESAFNPGQRLEVIEFQRVKGVQRETVIETLRPSVYHKTTLIQVGQVIVETPEDKE